MSRKPAAYPMFLKKFRGTEEEQAEFLKLLPGDAREDFVQVFTMLRDWHYWKCGRCGIEGYFKELDDCPGCHMPILGTSV